MILHLLVLLVLRPLHSYLIASDDDDGGWHRPIMSRCSTFQARPPPSTATNFVLTDRHPSGLRLLALAAPQLPIQPEQTAKNKSGKLSSLMLFTAHSAYWRPSEFWWWRDVATSMHSMASFFLFRAIRIASATGTKLQLQQIWLTLSVHENLLD